MGLLNIGLIIVFKIQIWNNKILQQEKKCVLLKKMKTFSKKCPQIYSSISEANTKTKVCKKSKSQKCIQSHMSCIFIQ